MSSIYTLLINYGIFGIIIAGLIEAIFLPVPMEVVSVPIYLANPKEAFLFSCTLVVFSVFSSMINYEIAKKFGAIFLRKLEDLNAVQKVKGWYDHNAVVTLITSAVMPIPYEVYVATAGLCRVNRKRFFIGCLFSRMLRHLPQGILITFGGNEALTFVKNNMILVVGVIIVIALARWLIGKKVQK